MVNNYRESEKFHHSTLHAVRQTTLELDTKNRGEKSWECTINILHCRSAQYRHIFNIGFEFAQRHVDYILLCMTVTQASNLYQSHIGELCIVAAAMLDTRNRKIS